MDFTGIDLDLDDLIDEDPPPSTKRLRGSAQLVIEDKYEPLFTSATWTLVGSIENENGRLTLQKSAANPQAHSEAFTKRWARQLIRQNQAKLSKAGVDVDAAYVKWGGRLEDLE